MEFGIRTQFDCNYFESLYTSRNDIGLKSQYKKCKIFDREYFDAVLRGILNEPYLKILDAIAYCYIRYNYLNKDSFKCREVPDYQSSDIDSELELYDKRYTSKIKIGGLVFIIHDKLHVSCLFSHRVFYLNFKTNEYHTEPKMLYGRKVVKSLYYAYDICTPDTIALCGLKGIYDVECKAFLSWYYSDLDEIKYHVHDEDIVKAMSYMALMDMRNMHEQFNSYISGEHVSILENPLHVYVCGKIVDLSGFGFKTLYYGDSHSGMFEGLHEFEAEKTDNIESLIIDLNNNKLVVRGYSSDIVDDYIYCYLHDLRFCNDRGILRKFAL